MKQLMILLTILMTTNHQAQKMNLEQGKEPLAFFQKEIGIPEGYSFKSLHSISPNNVNAYLFRYEKASETGLGKEHFSFIVTEKPFKILGTTFMDAKYNSSKLLSKEETEKVARAFLNKLDPQLDKELVNQWIDQHDEEILVNGRKTKITGMKYKCYRKLNNDYTWVIVANDGSVITFERDIIWNTVKQQRKTEKWLHDNWLSDKKNNYEL